MIKIPWRGEYNYFLEKEHDIIEINENTGDVFYPICVYANYKVIEQPNYKPVRGGAFPMTRKQYQDFLEQLENYKNSKKFDEKVKGIINE